MLLPRNHALAVLAYCALSSCFSFLECLSMRLQFGPVCVVIFVFFWHKHNLSRLCVCVECQPMGVSWSANEEPQAPEAHVCVFPAVLTLAVLACKFSQRFSRVFRGSRITPSVTHTHVSPNAHLRCISTVQLKNSSKRMSYVNVRVDIVVGRVNWRSRCCPHTPSVYLDIHFTDYHALRM